MDVRYSCGQLFIINLIILAEPKMPYNVPSEKVKKLYGTLTVCTVVRYCLLTSWWQNE